MIKQANKKQKDIDYLVGMKLTLSDNQTDHYSDGFIKIKVID